jgi:hypothetical protein
MAESFAEEVQSGRAGRKRLERIRQLRAELDAAWSATTPLARQVVSLEFAREPVGFGVLDAERHRVELVYR